MNDNTFSIIVDDKEITYKVIKILCPTNISHRYIIYTDGKEIFASRFVLENESIVLKNIETKSEWDYIDSCLEKIS